MSKPTLETPTHLSSPVERHRLAVRGVVQGVGFRPFVYGLSTRLGLTGFVGNDSQGVVIEIEGDPTALRQFEQHLRAEPPPLAHLEQIDETSLPVQGSSAFVIVASTQTAGQHTLISPDLSICDTCLAELFDPQNRRYRYPFINCTHCGPRFTITRDLPYDRPMTTMADFFMCPACQAEYEDPLNRRFHAQPNACSVCGPQVEWRIANGEWQVVDDPIRKTQALLAAGQIVAVKGIGGFHLACDASNDQAVQMLRQRKGRVEKPFAVMAWDVEAVRRFAEVNNVEERLLISRERPIVLLRKRPDCPLSPWIAPGNQAIGVMLPYSPLHYLLLDKETRRQRDKETERLGRSPLATHHSPLAIRNSQFVLVMTSGNLSEEPIVKENAEALEKLGEVADAFLLHNRPIHLRCDDSVARVFAGGELPIRRSRGYAPFPVKLPFTPPSILAVGGELKSTFCLTSGDHAFLSQHIGDMENLETLQAFGEAVEHFKTIFRVQPTIIASDLHPGYLSAKWAQQAAQAAGIPYIQVQHHHAHIAALMAEHGLTGERPVIGFSFDGAGYGTDGAIWGGELLIADYRRFQRAGHLKYIPLPGGDVAVKRPYRLALAHLWTAGVDWDERLPPVVAATNTERRILARQFSTGFNCVLTSSIGRLFDAVAALAGVRQTITYEGQAAIELEMLADEPVHPLIDASSPYHLDWQPGEISLFDPAPLVRAVAADVLAGVPGRVISTWFHSAIATLITQLSLYTRQTTGLNQVALSGGVFQNVRLLKLTVQSLHAHQFEVLWHHRVPPNDGGLALGQAMVASFAEDEGMIR